MIPGSNKKTRGLLRQLGLKSISLQKTASKAGKTWHFFIVHSGRQACGKAIAPLLLSINNVIGGTRYYSKFFLIIKDDRLDINRKSCFSQKQIY